MLYLNQMVSFYSPIKKRLIKSLLLKFCFLLPQSVADIPASFSHRELRRILLKTLRLCR
ncbi:hypothetical protein COI_0678 [Mannheimia haemolytica serotype A2 str. OVINE]|nr:hypothetical protein COI_0678 [Mannheimia haemolytica serotype A2 str. OVINE]